MISAMKHDPEMFYLGFDYKMYIHEGTNQYWKTSLKRPSQYATWIYMYNLPDKTAKLSEDFVAANMSGNPDFTENFYKVYSNGQLSIYHKKSSLMTKS